MKNGALILVSIVVILGLLVAAWIVGSSLPADAILPVHWDAAGRINGFAGKWAALCMPAFFCAVITALFTILPLLPSSRPGLEQSQGLIRTIWIGMLGLFVILQWVVISAARHIALDQGRVVIGAVGLLLLAIGNQLGKSRPMRFVGIRTPWTLADPDIWIATHRLGGKLLAGAGIVWFVFAVADAVNERTLPLLMGVVVVASVIPAAWSYVLWRRRTPAA